MTRTTAAPRRASALARASFALQAFLLRRNLLGPAGDQLMVITTAGRKSGKRFSTPIAYAVDGRDYLAFSRGGGSNWYHNALASRRAALNVRGRDFDVDVQPIIDDEEVLRVLDIYKRERPGLFKRFIGVPIDGDREAWLKARETCKFVRFRPIQSAA